MDTKLFLKDFSKIQDFFPKIKYHWSDELKSVIISGELDICDKEGVYWETFSILLILGSNYPFSIPVLVEVSEKIPREDKRHISKEGACCLDIEHNLLVDARRGINLYNFFKERVYPFFANQLFFEKEEKFANGEWGHQFDGIRQFYSMELGMEDNSLIITFLKKLISKNLPGRNDECLCGEMKYKYCHHKDSMDFLSCLPQHRILSDLEGFEKLVISS